MKKDFKSLLFAILSFKIIQLLMRAFGSRWVFLSDSDLNYYLRGNLIRMRGDRTADPTKFTSVRSDWILRALMKVNNHEGFLGFHDFQNMRMVCKGVKLKVGEEFTVGIGREPCDFFLLGENGRPTLELVRVIFVDEARMLKIKHL